MKVYYSYIDKLFSVAPVLNSLDFLTMIVRKVDLLIVYYLLESHEARGEFARGGFGSP